MAFTWGILAVVAVGLVLGLIYRSARSRREYLVLAFTERIGLPVTPEIVDRVDRRIRDGFIGFSLGALAALVTFGAVVLFAPQFVPTGLAGFAVSGVAHRSTGHRRRGVGPPPVSTSRRLPHLDESRASKRPP